MSFILTLLFLAIVFGSIYWFRNRTGEKVIITDHEYFSRLWLWPKGEHTRWEAEFNTKSEFSDGTVGIHAQDNYETIDTPEPTEKEIEFSKIYLSDLKRIFPIVGDGVRQGWKEWFQEDLPDNWENEFVVDGFSVPVNGDAQKEWSVMLYCGKAGHYFSIDINNGISELESIDG